MLRPALPFRSTVLALAGLVLAAGAPAARADEPAEALHYVFALHPDKDFAEVFEGGSLRRLGRAPAPRGAFRVLGLPAGAGRGDSVGGAKFYIVGSGEVFVLDETLRATGRIRLRVAPLARKEGAALTADGRLLLLASADGLYKIETARDALAGYLPAGFQVAGLALARERDRAFLLAAGRPWMRGVNLARWTLDAGRTPTPGSADAWGRSPNGVRAAVHAGGEVFDFDTVAAAGERDSSGEEQAENTARPTRLALTDSGRVYVGQGGRVRSLSLVGGGAEVDLAEAAAWDASPAGEGVYIANASGELVRLSADGGANVSAKLSGAPGAVEAVVPRVEQTGTLGLTGSANLVVAGGQSFQIAVKAANDSGGPQQNVVVFLSNRFPVAPAVNCVTAITAANGEATLDCTLGGVTQPVAIQLTLSDTLGRSAPVVNVQAVVPTPFDGLALISEEAPLIPDDTEFSIVVQASARRVPLAGVALSMTTVPNPAPAVNCARAATTGPDGRATFACRTGVNVTDPTNVGFVITGPGGLRLETSIGVDPQAPRQTGMVKIEGDGQLVAQGNVPFQLAVGFFRDGVPQAGVNLNVTVVDPGQPPAATCPLLTPATNEEGIVRFTCRSGTVFGEGRRVRIQVTTSGAQLAQPFEVTITQSTTGFARTLEFVSDEFFAIPVGRRTPNALRVRALTGVGGNPVPNQLVHFTVPPGSPVTVDPPSARTNAQGIAATSVTIGCTLEQHRIDIGFEPDRPSIDAFVRATPGGFARIEKVQGDNQSGFPGQQLNAQALVARTLDLCGIEVSGVDVVWRAKPAFAVTLLNVVARSDSNGRVSVLARLGQFGGPLQVEVASGEASANFNLTVLSDATDLRAISGSGQTVGGGQTTVQPLVAQAVGSNGFGVSGVAVEWSIVDGPGTLVDPAAATDGAGIAFARVRVGGGAGNPVVRVRATAVGRAVEFSVNGASGPSAPLNGFVNGGSFQPGWTPGSAASIFGTELARELTIATTAPFPTTLGGVTVRVNGSPAPLFFVSPGQINLQVPFPTPLGPTTVEIENDGRTVTVRDVPVTRVQPGIFVIPGENIAAALHQDSTRITPESPARPGEVVQLFFTGGGPLNQPVATNQPGPASPLPFTEIPVVVGVDSVGQEFLGAVYAPGLISAYQVNFRLSPTTAPGNRRLNLVMDGVASPDVTLPVGAEPVP